MVLQEEPPLNGQSNWNSLESNSFWRKLVTPGAITLLLASIVVVVGGILRIRRATIVSSQVTLESVSSQTDVDPSKRRNAVRSPVEEPDELFDTNQPRRWSSIGTFRGFWRKVPLRFWNFYIDAFMIPSYRKEWGKYKVWNCKSPLRSHLQPMVLAQIRMKRKVEATTKEALKQINRPDSEPVAVAHNHMTCQRVRINVGGCRYETQLRTLQRFPETLLGDPLQRIKYYDPSANEYYFDRNRNSFEAILYYYQSGGKLRRPDTVSADIMLDDMKFYQLGQPIVHAYLISEGLKYANEEEEVLPENLLLRKIWLLFDVPESSVQAQLVTIISVATIAASIVIFCMETLEDFTAKRKFSIDSKGIATVEEFDSLDIQDPFFFMESACSIWFLTEYVARLACSPAKATFVKSFSNIIDLLAILPYFFTIISGSTAPSGHSPQVSFSVIRLVRLVRVFRIFKLSRHSKGLKILGKTLHASLNELMLLIFFIIIGAILFSSAVYFAEQGNENTQFHSIPEGFWWAIITITTVGFGDVIPSTTSGRIIGAMCAVAGVLTIALPVPVIVSNFNYFYHQAIDEQDLSWIKINHVPNCPYRPMGGCNFETKKRHKKRNKTQEEPKYSSDEEFSELKNLDRPRGSIGKAKTTIPIARETGSGSLLSENLF